MLSRVAEDTFWMSRYLERAVAVVRLIDVLAHLELDAGESDDRYDEFWTPLLDPGRPDSFVSEGASPARTPEEVRYHLVFDPSNPHSVVSCISRSREAAREVRDGISSEMWERLNTLHLSLQDPHLVRLADEDSHAFFKRVHEEALLVFGLGDYTLAHDEPWQFITLGKYLERASNVARVLSLESRLLRGGDPLARGGGGDTVVRWLAVLRSCGSAEAYARYYSLRVEPARMVEFLVLNPVFPQSVRFSVDAASDALAAIDAQRPRSEPTDGAGARALGQLRARLDHVAVDEVLEEGLEGYLADVQRRIGLVSERVARAHFRADPQPVRHAAARAALIMAAQQQQ
jgi:uncharacterized alpha-E superfamily protein